MTREWWMGMMRITNQTMGRTNENRSRWMGFCEMVFCGGGECGIWLMASKLHLVSWRMAIMQKLWTLLQAARKSSRRRKKQWKEAVDKWFIGNFSWTLCSLQTFLWMVSAKTEKRIGRHFRSGIKMDGIKKSMSKWSFPLLFSSRFNCNRITMVQSKKSFKLDDGYKQLFIWYFENTPKMDPKN